MSLKRIISLSLLVLYGVPASFGPHWHAHSHGHLHFAWSNSGECCDAEDTDSCGHSHVEGQSAGSPVDESPAAGDCSGCSTLEPLAVVATTSSGHPQDDHGEVVASAGQDGHCVICDYYSQAKFATHAIQPRPTETFFASCKQLASLASSQRLSLSRARGPPLSS
ncbi:MAG: hypothetical protein NXI32_16090 [bacterium]|nr:hypothetical protein [bacterium]